MKTIVNKKANIRVTMSPTFLANNFMRDVMVEKWGTKKLSSMLYISY